MGIKDFTTPYIKDTTKSKNATLRDLTHSSSSPIIIGFDMSVVIIKAMSVSSTIISAYHSEPKVPLTELTDNVIATIKSYFIHGMHKAVLVFDGLTHKLKKEGAHQARYQNTDDMRQELTELYTIKHFESQEEEKIAVAKVKKLRSSLSPIREDIIHDIVVKAMETFGNKVVCIGSPYESDHQLASLFHQKVIDYVVTTDTDLIFLGCSLILDFNPSTSKCWKMSLPELLSDRLPRIFKTEGVTWTRELLIHVGCFLGNDFINRVPGNGPGKVKLFVESVKDMTENEVYNYIHDEVVVATAGARNNRPQWQDPQKKKDHVRLWKQSHAMFINGPVFIVVPNDIMKSVRESVFDSEEFTIRLDSMAGDKNDWMVNGEELLVGYHPHEEIVDKLDIEVPTI
eukprot:scaffold367_cov250-Chaetoceros_neogracile.AAC.1